MLYIVACSATKARTLSSAPMPARDAYTGQAFRMCRFHLERLRLKWCILSAHYGFIWPSTLIESYDVKMTPVTPSTCWDNCFGAITNRQYARLITEPHITVLGSRLYSDAASVLLQRPALAPLAGLTIGHMLSAINRCAWIQKPTA